MAIHCYCLQHIIPQTDGQTERIIRVLEDTLRHHISPRQDNWNEHLPHIEFSYINACQELIATSPFMLNYGAHPRVPGLVTLDKNQADRFQGLHAFKRQIDRRLELANKCIAKAQARQETYYNQVGPTQEGGATPGRPGGALEYSAHQDCFARNTEAIA